MASSIAPNCPPTHNDVADQRGNEMAVPSFSVALRFTRELAFGVLAIMGCLVVQGLILSWLVLSGLQIRFVWLQARMLRRLYGPARQPAKRVSAAETEVQASQHDHVEHDAFEQVEPVDLPSDLPSDLPDAGAVTTREPLNPEAPIWHTKTVTARKTVGGRTGRVKQIDVIAPPGFHPQKAAATVADNKLGKQINVIAPPGFDPQKAAAKVAENKLALGMSSDAVHGNQTTERGSMLPGEVTATSKPTDSKLQFTTLTVKLPFVNSETKTQVTRDSNFQSTSLSGFLATQPSAIPSETPATFTRPANNGKIARGRAVKIVQSAQPEGYRLESVMHSISENASGALTNNKEKARTFQTTTDIASPGKLTASYGGIKAAPLSELRHRFIDTSPLKKEIQNDILQPVPLVNVTPPTPKQPPTEQAAREALVAASKAREIARVRLNTSYSPECALDFDEKAKAYKMRRQELATHMPWSELSSADEQAFPYLSSKNTVKPQAITAMDERVENVAVLPSPPESSEEDEKQPQPREDPSPHITKAAKAYQVLLQATRNIKEECAECNSKFCEEGYSGMGKNKLKAARDLYLRSCDRVAAVYDAERVPDSLSDQLPSITWC